MLSLVMGFSSKHTKDHVNRKKSSGIHFLEMLSFDKRLYNIVMKWVFAAVIFYISVFSIIITPISTLDIIGTLFCAPLVSYIFHLLILIKKECDIGPELPQN
jgi:hypothetical protein